MNIVQTVLVDSLLFTSLIIKVPWSFKRSFGGYFLGGGLEDLIRLDLS
jgi:hypothetical protein